MISAADSPRVCTVSEVEDGEASVVVVFGLPAAVTAGLVVARVDGVGLGAGDGDRDVEVIGATVLVSPVVIVIVVDLTVAAEVAAWEEVLDAV